MMHQFCIAINGVETRFLTPFLFKATNDAVEKFNLSTPIDSSTLSHTKPPFQQIFYNFKPFAQIKKNNFYLSVLNFC